MKLGKKMMALTMAGVMVLGSTMTVMGEDASSATGAGTNTGHLDTDVVVAVLPTSDSVANIFDFTIDPEDILAKADTFTDGSTTAGASFANDDLVYFKQLDSTYASTSQAVKIAAKNYVAADISVEVEVAAAAEGKTTIPLVADETALNAATSPALLLNLTVGTKTGAITSDGVKVTDKLAAQDSNFEIKRQSDGSYKVEPKSAVNDWSGLDVQLSGKVKGGTVDSTIAAPNLTLTWTVAKHVDAYVSSTTLSVGGESVTLSLPDEVTISSVILNKGDGSTVTLAAGNTYTLSGTTLAIKEAIVSSYSGATITITYSDNHVDTLTIN